MSAFVKLMDVNGDEVWVRRTSVVRIEPRGKRHQTAWVTFADGGHIETAKDIETFLAELEGTEDGGGT